MRRKTVATISVAASLALAACAERDTTSPRSINPGQASFSGGPNSTACDFTNISKAAKNYFTSNQDPVYGILSTWSSAYKNGPAAATSYGWQALGVVSTERLTSSTTTGDLGAVFVVMTVRCMIDLSNNNGSQLQLPAALTANNNVNLARVINSGIFEVRNGGHAGAPAAGKNLQGGVRSLGVVTTSGTLPRNWGVESAGPTWPGTITYAVIGYPIKDSNPLLTGQPQIDALDDLGATGAAYQTSGVWPFNAFELTLLPSGAVSDKSGFRVGICVTGNPGGNGSYAFLVHNDAELVPNSTPTTLCGLTTASLGMDPWYTRLAHSAARFFTTGTANAQDDSRDFIGGLPSGWSPMEGGNVNAANVSLAITTQPKNNVRDSVPNSLGVTVTTTTLTGAVVPVPQVQIDSLVVLNNQGSPAGAVIVKNSTNLPFLTDKNGQLTVNFEIGKPGAYYLLVWGSLDGTALNAATSVKFNVKN